MMYHKYLKDLVMSKTKLLTSKQVSLNRNVQWKTKECVSIIFLIALYEFDKYI